MKIYTKTGDTGQTSLATGRRVSKSDPQIETYGTSDELNGYIGWLRASITDEEWGGQVQTQLQWIQNRLFDLGAVLAGADMPLGTGATEQLEIWIDAMQSELEPLHAFILPAGSERMTRCHICRTVTRRLERKMVGWSEFRQEKGENDALRWVNRLSDYLFVLSRWIGKKEEIHPDFWEKA